MDTDKTDIYKLIGSVASSCGVYYDPDHWQHAAEAVVKALSRYESNKGKLSTFLWPCIRGALIDCVRIRGTANREAVMVPYDDSIITESSEATVTSYEQKEARGQVKALLSKLNDKERELVELCYYKEMNLREVADQMGVSKSWMCRLHGQTIDKLTRLLESSGLTKDDFYE